MKIDRKVLLKVLESVSRGLAKKSVAGQGDHFVFLKGEVIAFNDEVLCRRPSGLGDVEAAVPAELLLSLLGKLDEAEVDVDVVDGEFLTKAGRKRAGIRIAAPELFVGGVEEPESWIEAPKELPEALSIVRSCCGTDSSKFVLTCVHVAPGWLEATDRYQVIRYRLKTGFDDSLLVRGSALAGVADWKAKEMSSTENWLHFRSGDGLRVSVRKFVPVHPYVGDDKLAGFLKVDGAPAKLPKELDSVLTKAGIFLTDGSSNVEVELRSDKVKIVGRGPRGWYSEVAQAEWKGDDAKFAISPSLLSEVIGKSEKVLVAPGRILVDAGKWRLVLCTKKLED